MYTVKLLLGTTAYDRRVIAKRFHALSHIHNVLVKHARRLLYRLEHDEAYQELLKEYAGISRKKNPSREDTARKEDLAGLMNGTRKGMGFTEAGLQAYIKVCAGRYRSCLSSQQVQKEASRVWKSVEAFLFRNGKEIHFKKGRDFHSIGGKTNTNGVKFDPEAFSIEWLGLEVPCRMPKNRKSAAYVTEALGHTVSYCELSREMFPDGWHYYVVLYLRGEAPERLAAGSPDVVTGIDPGTSTMAVVSSESVDLFELAPRCQEYNRKIVALQQRMDRSRRDLNPENYNPDGTAKKGRRKWEYSNSYKRAERQLKSLYRRKSAYIKTSHGEQTNRMLGRSTTFIVEGMDYKKLQKRAKNTERQEKETPVPQGDGSVKLVRKYKRKKRFGRSLNNRSPALFLTMLGQKAARYGGSVKKADTMKFKASQYNHATNGYEKIPLSQRFREVGGHLVQRDLYSAYLLSNSQKNLKKPNRKKCAAGFGEFCRMMDEKISDMKENGVSMRQCFGF